MIYDEEQRARDRSEYLAFQYPDVRDPLKEQVRKLINDEIDRKRKEKGSTAAEFLCVLLAICVACLILAFAGEVGDFVGTILTRNGLL